MKNLLAYSWIAASIALPQHVDAWTGPIYLSGHADIGVEYQTAPSRLELFIRLDGDTQFSEGYDLSLQLVSPEEVAIRAPNPPLYRQHYIGDPLDPDDDYNVTGPEWDFLGVDQDEPFWFMPQSSDPHKPFFGFATDGLTPTEWAGVVEWSLESIVSAPAGGEVSLWQADLFGHPQVKYASFDGIDEQEDTFIQAVGGHDHYNWGFSKPGVYEVELGAEVERVGVGPVQGSGVFTFLVGEYMSQSSPGDFNEDGVVDSVDYAVWREHLGAEEEAQVLSGNGTGGQVDGDDYQLWREHYGTVYSSAIAQVSQQVPELGGGVLAIIALGCCVLRRRCWGLRFAPHVKGVGFACAALGFVAGPASTTSAQHFDVAIATTNEGQLAAVGGARVFAGAFDTFATSPTTSENVHSTTNPGYISLPSSFLPEGYEPLPGSHELSLAISPFSLPGGSSANFWMWDGSGSVQFLPVSDGTLFRLFRSVGIGNAVISEGASGDDSALAPFAIGDTSAGGGIHVHPGYGLFTPAGMQPTEGVYAVSAQLHMPGQLESAPLYFLFRTASVGPEQLADARSYVLAATGIPEPSSVVFAVAASVVLLGRRNVRASL